MYEREIEVMEETESGFPIAVLLTYTEPGGRKFVTYERVFPIAVEEDMTLYPISICLN